MSKVTKSVEYGLFEGFSNVDEENVIVGAVTQAVEKSPKNEQTKKFQKIEDFGEKIGGARKDLYAAYCDLIKVATETEVEKVLKIYGTHRCKEEKYLKAVMKKFQDKEISLDFGR